MADLGVSPKREKVTPSGGGSMGKAAGFRASIVGQLVQVATLPNTRVQRTRSSASPPHSPLTRSPLGPPASLSAGERSSWSTTVRGRTCLGESWVSKADELRMIEADGLLPGKARGALGRDRSLHSAWARASNPAPGHPADDLRPYAIKTSARLRWLVPYQQETKSRLRTT